MVGMENQVQEDQVVPSLGQVVVPWVASSQVEAYASLDPWEEGLQEGPLVAAFQSLAWVVLAGKSLGQVEYNQDS